jgi:tetratricopeptide (TPR) repeat protein
VSLPREPADRAVPRRSLAFARLLAGLAMVLSFQAPAQVATPAGTPAPSARDRAVDAGPLQALLDQGGALLRRGESRAAFELLKPREAVYAGTPGYDYLLGLAALDSGQPGQAILALERVLAIEPGHLQARAEIARAYLATREREAARREFETVAAQSIPADVRRVIDGYLAGIAQAQAEVDGQSGAYLETGFGWDSNVNFGSLSSQWVLADGTAVTPLAVNQPRSSPFMSVTLGGFRVWPMGGGFDATIGGTISHRANPSAHTLDQTSADVTIGVQHRRSCHTTAMQAQHQQIRLDQSAFRNATGLLAQWRCDLDSRTQVGAFAQAFAFTFPDQSVRDARRLTLGTTFARALQGGGDPIVVGNLYAGQERPQQALPQLEYRFVGARASVNARLPEGWRGHASLSYEARNFAGEEALFGAVRQDRQTELRLGADKDLSRHWSIAPQLIATRNASTLAPNDFRRVQAFVFTRYRF